MENNFIFKGTTKELMEQLKNINAVHGDITLEEYLNLQAKKQVA